MVGLTYANVSYLRDHLTLIISTCPVGPTNEAIAGPISLEVLSGGIQEDRLFCCARHPMELRASPGDQLGPNPAGFLQSSEFMVLPMVLGTWVHGGAGTVAARFVSIKGISLAMSFMNLTMLYRGVVFFFLF